MNLRKNLCMVRFAAIVLLFTLSASLTACRKPSDESLFKTAPPENYLLTRDEAIQQIAEEQIVGPLRAQVGSSGKMGKLPPDTDCAFVCIENATGNVLAYVPSCQLASEFDNCRFSRRDIGSTAKPLIYATALQSGRVSPGDTFLDAPMSFPRRDGPGTYTAQNYGGHYTGRWLSIKEAISLSSNSVALQVYQRVPESDIQAMLSALSLPSECNKNLMALGRWSVPVLSLAAAFTVFPRGGDAVVPRFIAAKIRPDNQLSPLPVGTTAHVFSPEVCALISRAMHACVQTGTGAAAAHDLADFVRGKTGSTSDALSVLQSRGVTTALWIGRRNSNADLHMTGGRLSMPALARFFRALKHVRPDLVPSWE